MGIKAEMRIALVTEMLHGQFLNEVAGRIEANNTVNVLPHINVLFDTMGVEAVSFFVVSCRRAPLRIALRSDKCVLPGNHVQVQVF